MIRTKKSTEGIGDCYVKALRTFHKISSNCDGSGSHEHNGDFMSPHIFLQGLRINAVDYIEVLQKFVFF